MSSLYGVKFSKAEQRAAAEAAVQARAPRVIPAHLKGFANTPSERESVNLGPQG